MLPQIYWVLEELGHETNKEPTFSDIPWALAASIWHSVGIGCQESDFGILAQKDIIKTFPIYSWSKSHGVTTHDFVDYDIMKYLQLRCMLIPGYPLNHPAPCRSPLFLFLSYSGYSSSTCSLESSNSFAIFKRYLSDMNNCIQVLSYGSGTKKAVLHSQTDAGFFLMRRSGCF